MAFTLPRRLFSFRCVGTIAGHIVAICVIASAAHAKSREAEALDLEPSLRAAALVLAVRVHEVQEMPVLYGGKGVDRLFQYFFEPGRVLKGVYSRPELILTGADLQAYPGSFDPQDIQAGQQRLLLLGRSRVGYRNIHLADTADRAFPLLDDDSDSLLRAADALLSLQELRDRRELVGRLSAQLRDADDRGAVALLAALERRAYVAAQHFPALESVARQLGSESAMAREAAADVLASLLDADYLNNPTARELAITALVGSLERAGSPLAPRVAALQAMASAADAARANADAMRLVDFEAPYDTFAELSARLDVLGRLHANSDAHDSVSRFVSGLPLDAPRELQQSAARAWARIAGPAAADLLFERIERKRTLGVDGVAEVEAFGLIFTDATDPWLLQRTLIEFGLRGAERAAFVEACDSSPTAELVPTLAGMLDPRRQKLRRLSTDLLMKIDSVAAAEALRPHLAEENDLAYKLHLAAFLGRHGFDDGYPYALEHMSEPQFLDAAVEALADIRKPGSVDQLLNIYTNSNDLGWQRAAVRALGLLGSNDFRGELGALTQDLDHPLAAAALEARADLGDVAVIERLPAALSSRSEALVIAGARAAATLLPQLQNRRSANELSAALTAIARDPEAVPAVRQHALEALVGSESPDLDETLIAMVRDIRIEQSGLLVRVRDLLRERSVEMP